MMKMASKMVLKKLFRLLMLLIEDSAVVVAGVDADADCDDVAVVDAGDGHVFVVNVVVVAEDGQKNDDADDDDEVGVYVEYVDVLDAEYDNDADENDRLM